MVLRVGERAADGEENGTEREGIKKIDKADIGLGDEEGGEAGAGDGAEIPEESVEAEGATEMLGRDEVGDNGLEGGFIHGGEDRGDGGEGVEGEDGDLVLPGEDGEGKRDEGDGGLGGDEEPAAVEGIGEEATDEDEEDDGEDADEAEGTEAEGLGIEGEGVVEEGDRDSLVGEELVDMPIEGDELHLGAEGGE